MVRRVRQGTGRWLAVLLAVLVLPQFAWAAVVASVDRSDVDLNESFTLKVTVDSSVDTVPDASALDKDFYVGATSQLSNTTIVNGQISRSRTWTYVLMARRTGELQIPPVRVGPESSNPLFISVSRPSNALPGEADIFVASEVDYEESYVQAQILYTVKVYRSVATRQPRLSEPAIEGVEVLAEVAGEEKSYESILNGKSYNVVERVYALFPQESGELSIAPTRFEARVLKDGRITGRKVFDSDPVTVVVKPIPPPPVDFPDAAWFPARSVELSEDWSREPGRLPAGEPITRHITVTALGQLSTQIPVIEPDVPDSVKIYPDKPELRVVAEARGIRASRKDQYAMIGITPGDIELPALELPWWNIDASEWQIASLPPTRISILPTGDEPPQAEAAPEQEAASAPAGDAVIVLESRFWRQLSAGLAAAWLMTMIAWWWTRRPQKTPREPEPPPVHKMQARLLKDARRAAADADSAGVKSALLRWGRLEWPDGAPRSVGELASRVSDPLATELNEMCSMSYGPGDRDWDGRTLAKALRSVRVLRSESVDRGERGLPPLMPNPPAMS